MLRRLIKAEWLTGLVALVAVVALSDSPWMRDLDYAIYDTSVRLLPAREMSDQVVVLAIDDRSVDTLGPWPWSRDVLALGQRLLNEMTPGVVAYLISFEAARNERGLRIMAEFRDAYGKEMSRRLQRRLQNAVNRLDTDHALSASFRDAGNVVLGVPFLFADASSGTLSSTSRDAKFIVAGDAKGARSALPQFLRPPGVSRIAELFEATEKVAAGAMAMAPAINLQQQGALRALPLLVSHEADYLPTLPLRLVMAQAGLSVAALTHGELGIRISGETLTDDYGARVHPRFYDLRSTNVFSFVDLIEGRIDADRLRDRIVLIGLTTPRYATLHETPRGMMPTVTATAHTVSALLRGDVIAVTEFGQLVHYAVLVLIAAYLVLVAPRLPPLGGFAVAGLLLLMLLNASFFTLLLHSSWLPLASSIVLLLGGHLLLGASGLVRARIAGYQLALSESNRMLGQTLQAQGQLDEAFAKFRQCVDTEEVVGLIYSLGLDFERKRQFHKAAEVFDYLASRRRRYRDVAARAEKNHELDARLVRGMDARHHTVDTLIITGDEVQNPVLGRYEVLRELGRGAMGMVYLGHDPKIGRTVAIKTMALDQEFDADNIEEVRQRFFREAETAGRLNHPNIVTIYDVGEELDLSYIAMDYIDGDPLSRFVDGNRLLPVAKVLEFTAQVADALHYAHERNVVHRDIKPGNIMLETSSQQVTVTDFGVACLTDASRTKTGTILGSPSYMSPEQLEGHRVDGRSDIYSLGVTLFQLATGQLPFVADSLSSLMYRIANESHPNPCKLRPELPDTVRTIINRALHKKADRRYSNGAQMASALRRCAERIDQARDVQQV